MLLIVQTNTIVLVPSFLCFLLFSK